MNAHGTGSRVWADGFGVWHAAITHEVPGDVGLARAKARMLIRDELVERELSARNYRVRVSLVESTELDGAITHHFKEV